MLLEVKIDIYHLIDMFATALGLLQFTLHTISTFRYIRPFGSGDSVLQYPASWYTTPLLIPAVGSQIVTNRSCLICIC